MIKRTHPHPHTHTSLSFMLKHTLTLTHLTLFHDKTHTLSLSLLHTHTHTHTLTHTLSQFLSAWERDAIGLVEDRCETNNERSSSSSSSSSDAENGKKRKEGRWQLFGFFRFWLLLFCPKTFFFWRATFKRQNQIDFERGGDRISLSLWRKETFWN